MTDKNEFSPIKVEATRKGLFGHARWPGEKFDVVDGRSDSEIEISMKSERPRPRMASITMLGSWMKRVDGGVNPADGKLAAAIRRANKPAIQPQATIPTSMIQPIEPVLAGQQIVDANVTPVAVPPIQPVESNPVAETAPKEPTANELMGLV